MNRDGKAISESDPHPFPLRSVAIAYRHPCTSGIAGRMGLWPLLRSFPLSSSTKKTTTLLLRLHACASRECVGGARCIYIVPVDRVYSGVVRCLVTPSSTIFISLFVILCLLCLSLRNKRGSHYALATY